VVEAGGGVAVAAPIQAEAVPAVVVAILRVEASGGVAAEVQEAVATVEEGRGREAATEMAIRQQDPAVTAQCICLTGFLVAHPGAS